MNLKEDIRPISYLKANTASMLDQVNNTHRPVIITQNGEARAVLQDAESFESMRKTLGLLKLLAQSEKDIQEGRVIDHDELFDELETELDRRLS